MYYCLQLYAIVVLFFSHSSATPIALTSAVVNIKAIRLQYILSIRYLTWPYGCSTCPSYTSPGHKAAVHVVHQIPHLATWMQYMFIRYLTWPYGCSTCCPSDTSPGHKDAVHVHHMPHLSIMMQYTSIRYLTWPYGCSTCQSDASPGHKDAVHVHQIPHLVRQHILTHHGVGSVGAGGHWRVG